MSEKKKAFKEWVAEHCPSLNSKIEACWQELADAASVVDIDFANTRLSPGKVHNRDIATFTKESKGRCRMYFNTKDYKGEQFPHFVFQNFRAAYSDSSSGKAIPSVVNTVGILFEQYQSDSPIRTKCVKSIIHDEKPVVNRMILVNEQRRWFSKLVHYGTNNRESLYFINKSIGKEHILADPFIDFRLGFSRRYGQYVALPMRYLHQNTFMGFQRIYDTGEKIMMKGFDPTGLCFYFASDETALESSTLRTLIIQEGGANSLLAHIFTKELGLLGVANVGGLYADNLPALVEICESELTGLERILLIYDNDTNNKGKIIAERCQEICPRLKVDCFERNDLSDMISGFNFNHAKKSFAQMLMNAFK